MGIKEFEEKHRDIILNVLGVFFLGWGIIAVGNSFFVYDMNQVLWHCYLGLLLIGIGILSRSGFLIGAQLSILTIPLLIWDIDFLYYLFLGESLWGITDYMFVDRRLVLSQIISLQHLFTVPLALFCLSRIKSRRIDFWKLAILQVFLLFLAVLFFTPPEVNINCVFENCLHLVLNLPYRITWFLIFFSLVLVTNYALSKIKFIRK